MHRDSEDAHENQVIIRSIVRWSINPWIQRDRERERKTEREIERESDRQKERQIDRQSMEVVESRTPFRQSEGVGVWTRLVSSSDISGRKIHFATAEHSTTCVFSNLSVRTTSIYNRQHNATRCLPVVWCATFLLFRTTSIGSVTHTASAPKREMRNNPQLTHRRQYPQMQRATSIWSLS